MSLSETCQELCNRGICKNDCCGPAPCTREEVKKINEWIEKHRPDLPEITDVMLGVSVTPTHPDLKCRYVQDRRCAIYEIRPQICRIFGTGNNKFSTCPHLPEHAKK